MDEVKISEAAIHEFRKQIDACVVQAQLFQTSIGRTPGGREISLVVTKLQEAKMWAGKILEEIGSSLPKEFRDSSKEESLPGVQPIKN